MVKIGRQKNRPNTLVSAASVRWRTLAEKSIAHIMTDLEGYCYYCIIIGVLIVESMKHF